MPEIKLDPGKLLGFKIIATGASTLTRRSPKIGVKNCPGVNVDDLAAGAVLKAKTGGKLPG
jgi:hypothetical protein